MTGEELIEGFIPIKEIEDKGLKLKIFNAIKSSNNSLIRNFKVDSDEDLVVIETFLVNIGDIAITKTSLERETFHIFVVTKHMQKYGDAGRMSFCVLMNQKDSKEYRKNYYTNLMTVKKDEPKPYASYVHENTQALYELVSPEVKRIKISGGSLKEPEIFTVVKDRIYLRAIGLLTEGEIVQKKENNITTMSVLNANYLTFYHYAISLLSPETSVIISHKKMVYKIPQYDFLSMCEHQDKEDKLATKILMLDIDKLPAYELLPF